MTTLVVAMVGDRVVVLVISRFARVRGIVSVNRILQAFKAINGSDLVGSSMVVMVHGVFGLGVGICDC